MAQQKSYDPTEVAVVVGALLVAHEGCEASYDEEEWDFAAGIQGEAVRSKNANRLGTIIVRTLQTCDDNQSLTALQKAGQLIPILIKDFNGDTVHAMAEGTIVDLPKKTYAKTGAEILEWKVRGIMESNIGGND